MLLEIIKQFIKLTKEQKELAKYRSQLLTMPLNIEALQAIVDTAKDHEIVVNAKDFHLVIKPTKPENVKAKTFKERYEEAHK